MSRIYDALAYAQKQRRTEIAPTPVQPVRILRPTPRVAGREEMMRLYTAIESMTEAPHGRLIQVASAHHGEGATTIARDLATAVAEFAGRRVLLVDADRNRVASLHGFFDVPVKVGLDRLAAVSSGRSLEEAIQEIVPNVLYLAGLDVEADGAHVLFDAERFDRVLDGLRLSFDLVIFDSPPLLENAVGASLARRLDGVVLVVEAEKTRAPVVNEARRTVEDNGARMLGVVLNKRKRYIPSFLYRRL